MQPGPQPLSLIGLTLLFLCCLPFHLCFGNPTNYTNYNSPPSLWFRPVVRPRRHLVGTERATVSLSGSDRKKKSPVHSKHDGTRSPSNQHSGGEKPCLKELKGKEQKSSRGEHMSVIECSPSPWGGDLHTSVRTRVQNLGIHINECHTGGLGPLGLMRVHL